MTPRGRLVLVLGVAGRAPRAALRARAVALGFRTFAGERVHRLRLEDGSATVAILRVRDPESLLRLQRRTAGPGPVAIEWAGDRVIPLESLVAEGARERFWVVCDDVSHVPSALGALEHGAAKVVVRLSSLAELEQLSGLLDHAMLPDLDWSSVEVRRVQPVGVGDRVLVDTTSILRPTEGLLVGSAAGYLFAVASEAEGSDFSSPRAFRVNAGAAHSYVLCPDGSTRYLTELEPGAPVLAITPRGASRSVRVGRLKIERRPLVLIEALDGSTLRTIFLQEAETVRLFSGRARRAVTSMAPGDRVWGVRLPRARHLGQVVDEHLEER